MTLAAWVKIASFVPGTKDAAPWSSLMMTDRRGGGEGYVHWQISRNGALTLSVQPLAPEPNFVSPKVLFTKDLNVWHHVAVVYDKPAAQVTFYLDGTAVGSAAIRSQGALTIGHAQIGNWQPDAEPPSSRCFDGSMDELVVFRACLAPR